MLKHCTLTTVVIHQVDWGKGRALSHMLNALGLDDADDVIPIYLGDDRTDEDAFKVLKDRATGFGILISNKVSSLSIQSITSIQSIIKQLIHPPIHPLCH